MAIFFCLYPCHQALSIKLNQGSSKQSNTLSFQYEGREANAQICFQESSCKPRNTATIHPFALVTIPIYSCLVKRDHPPTIANPTSSMIQCTPTDRKQPHAATFPWVSPLFTSASNKSLSLSLICGERRIRHRIFQGQKVSLIFLEEGLRGTTVVDASEIWQSDPDEFGRKIFLSYQNHRKTS